MTERMLGCSWKLFKANFPHHNPNCYCGTRTWSKGKDDTVKRANRAREKRQLKKELKELS